MEIGAEYIYSYIMIIMDCFLQKNMYLNCNIYEFCVQASTFSRNQRWDADESNPKCSPFAIVRCHSLDTYSWNTSASPYPISLLLSNVDCWIGKFTRYQPNHHTPYISLQIYICTYKYILFCLSLLPLPILYSLFATFGQLSALDNNVVVVVIHCCSRMVCYLVFHMHLATSIWRNLFTWQRWDEQ